MVGSAAFLGGSGSIVLFVIVMMIEITADPEFILAITLGVIVARGCTSLFSKHSLGEGLYHSLIDVQSLPFLPEHEYSEYLKNCTRVRPNEGGRETQCAELRSGYTELRYAKFQNEKMGRKFEVDGGTQS